MTPLSAILIGEESLLVSCAEILLSRGHSLRAVVSRRPDIRRWAEGREIPVIEALDDIAGAGAFDWLFSIANLRVLPEQVLDLPRNGAVNFHDGPLPDYAGLNAPAWALINREAQFGITWHMLELGIDEGDILEQRMFEIAPDETAFTLNAKCFANAIESFGDLIEKLELGPPDRQRQSLEGRRYYSRLARPALAAHLQFSRSASDIAALVHALDFGDYWNPLALPKLRIGGQLVVLRGVAPAPKAGTAPPGTVLASGPDELTVATADIPLRLSRFSTLDGRPVEIAELATVGSLLTWPTDAAAKALNTEVEAAARGVGFWRRRLTTFHPAKLAQAPATGADPNWRSEHLGRFIGSGIAGNCAGTLIWAAQLSGIAEPGIAFADVDIAGRATRAAGYVSQWVPLWAPIASGWDRERLVEEMRVELERVQRLGTFAADIYARDPELLDAPSPDIGFSLAAGPVPGTCLTIEVTEKEVTLHIDAARVPAALADLLTKRLREGLAHIAEGGEPATWPSLPDAERALVLESWNATDQPLAGPPDVVAGFTAQCARTPQETALIFGDETLSYAALDCASNRMAQMLAGLGAGPGSRVGLMLPRGTNLMIAALGILKTGAAYVPLDPDYPADRVAYFIADSKAAIIITDTAHAGTAPAAGAEVVLMDTDVRIAQAPDTPLAATLAASDLAYVIYTSGSTGKPKGVMIEHRQLMNFFAGMDAHITHRSGDTWLAVTSLAFDISVLELFYTLCRGFRVVICREESRFTMSSGAIASGKPIDFSLFYWGNDDGAGALKYRLLLEGAKYADANGFCAVWTPERHFHAFGGPYPNPSVTGAAVAAVTERIGVRAGSCVAPLHHPARIAEEWAVIDNLTGGRAGLAIASGWQPDDFVLRPENTPPANKPAMYAAIDTLRKLWSGETVEFPRADGTMHSVVTQPRPVSTELPLWVTTAGNPQTWKEAGEIGANVLTHLLGQSVTEVGEKIKIYHQALRDGGRDPADHTVTLMLHSYLAETREQAREIARAPMKDYLRSAAALIKQYAWAFPAFKRPEGASNAFELDLAGLEGDEMEAILDFAFERYFEDSGLFGTVDDAVARAEQVKRIGVDEIACLIDYGIAPDLVLEGLKPLAEALARANGPAAPAADDTSLAAEVLRHSVTHLQCTPSLARMMAGDETMRGALGRVREMMVGGEGLPGPLAQSLCDALGGTLKNMYGPTETTIWSSVHDVGGDEAAMTPIGKPIANTQLYVLDEARAPVPIGVPGELWIAGQGVARGYWERTALSGEKFVPDPFRGGDARMYATGDMVRWRADGVLEYIGRGDTQIKIRGQRIELGEIEKALSDLTGIDEAVVIPREGAPGDIRLVGYYTGPAALDEPSLRTQLATRLPTAMVPAQFMHLPGFPLTPNNKIDRKALPAPVSRLMQAQTRSKPASSPATARPATGAEAQIAAIWSRILGVGEISRDDNFFALGGHSLLAVQAHREIKAELDLPRLPITDFFRYPTLGGLADHLGGALNPNPPSTDAAPDPARAETMAKRAAMRAGRRGRR